MSRSNRTKQILEESHAVLDGNQRPTNTETRSVIQIEGSLYVNITDFARSMHDIEKGDDVDIHTTTGGFCVEPETIERE